MHDLQANHSLNRRDSKKIARRQQLREFQREITEKTFRSEAKNNASESRRLGVQVGEEYLLMHLVQTGEVLSNPVITEIPNTKNWFLGLFTHRDRLLGLTDLAGMLGNTIAEKKKTDKVLTCAPSLSPHCAFRVTRIVGLVDSASMTSTAITEKEYPWLKHYYIDENKVRWAEINIQILVSHPAFLDIAL